MQQRDGHWIGSHGRIWGAVLGVVLVATLAVVGSQFLLPEDSQPGVTRPAQAAAAGPVMLILRGIAGPGEPRGQLDDESAIEYARKLGYSGEVLDVAGNTGADSKQVRSALDRIRGDENITALYGFSGGGYNVREIWKELDEAERARIAKVVVIGSPGVREQDFPGSAEVLIKPDPPEGHLAGPKVLLETVGSGNGEQPK